MYKEKLIKINFVQNQITAENRSGFKRTAAKALLSNMLTVVADSRFHSETVLEEKKVLLEILVLQVFSLTLNSWSVRLDV